MSGMCVAGMCVTGMCVAGMRVGSMGVAAAVAGMSGVSALAAVTDVGETADCHRGEASTAQREADPIDVHTLNTTCRPTGW
jgi:hypothetical protein